jgi:hypothetical protein
MSKYASDLATILVRDVFGQTSAVSPPSLHYPIIKTNITDYCGGSLPIWQITSPRNHP